MGIAAAGGHIQLTHYRLFVPLSVVLLSLSGAFCYALASVLQHQVAAEQPDEMAVKPSLLVRLVHQPLWLVGNVADGAGCLFQFLALRRGSQALVQPLLLCGLVFALPAAAVLRRQRPTRRDCVGALVVVVGIGVFLVAARPGAGQPRASLTAWVVVTAVIAGAVAAATVLARGSDRRRAILLGLAGGVLYGYTSAVAERTARLFDHGVIAVVTSWSPYVLVLAGAVGMLLAQSAFQAGALRWSLPTLTVAEPLVAIAIGRFLFGEHLASGGLAPLAQLLGVVVMIAGVFYAAGSPKGQGEVGGEGSDAAAGASAVRPAIRVLEG